MKKEEKEKMTLQNWLGFVTVIMVLLLNLLLIIIEVTKDVEGLVDNFGWGFMTALVLIIGLIGMFKKEVK